MEVALSGGTQRPAEEARAGVQMCLLVINLKVNYYVDEIKYRRAKGEKRVRRAHQQMGQARRRPPDVDDTCGVDRRES